MLSESAVCAVFTHKMTSKGIYCNESGIMQDPSYDPYGYYKAATRAATVEGGAASACAPNVQKFFQTVFDLARTSSGLDQINDNMNLCDDSQVHSYDDVNQTLAAYVTLQWAMAVRALANVCKLCSAVLIVTKFCDLPLSVSALPLRRTPTCAELLCLQ